MTRCLGYYWYYQISGGKYAFISGESMIAGHSYDRIIKMTVRKRSRNCSSRQISKKEKIRLHKNLCQKKKKKKNFCQNDLYLFFKTKQKDVCMCLHRKMPQRYTRNLTMMVTSGKQDCGQEDKKMKRGTRQTFFPRYIYYLGSLYIYTPML